MNSVIIHPRYYIDNEKFLLNGEVQAVENFENKPIHISLIVYSVRQEKLLARQWNDSSKER